MKRILPLLLALMLLLCACKKPVNDTTPSTEESTVPTTKATQPTTEPEDTTVPTETEIPMPYQNPLTGEPMAEPYTGRVTAVMLNNIKAAMPQHGVSQADILYEVLAEGGVTRCMGIFSDVGEVEKLGSIRSARKYYVDIARGYDAMYVHAGGSPEALSYIKSIGWEDLDGTTGANASSYFYRDQSRLNAGYSLEHTLFITGESVVDYATKLGHRLSYDNEVSFGLTFDDSAVIVGESARKVTVYFNQGGTPTSYTKSTVLTYDEDSKTYFAYQHGADYIDGNTNETIFFRNILILKAGTSIQSDGYHLTINTTGSGSGYFVCNGQMVNINWSRASVSDPFTYTLENGSPVTFGVGSTYIAVIPTNATAAFE